MGKATVGTSATQGNNHTEGPQPLDTDSVLKAAGLHVDQPVTPLSEARLSFPHLVDYGSSLLRSFYGWERDLSKGNHHELRQHHETKQNQAQRS